MILAWMRRIVSRSWVRIPLAVALVMVGLAPVGVPILSDNSWRSAGLPDGGSVAPAAAAEPFVYRWSAEANQDTTIERSDDGGQVWHAVASLPAEIAQIAAVPGDEQVALARGADAIWITRDGGASWTRTAALPSRPLALAVGPASRGAVFVGTESLGLMVSRDQGASWQAITDETLAAGGAGPLAVTALALDPGDDSIVYAATGLWLGTASARLTPLGAFVSLDSGQHWLTLASASLAAEPLVQLSPVAGEPLTVTALDGRNERTTLALALSGELVSLLESSEPGVRASAARAIGLIGDPAAAPALLASLTDPDPLAGDQAAEALGRVGDAAVEPALLAALNAENETVAARAAHVLGMLGAESAVAPLGELLRSGTPLAARSAAEALAAIGSPDALAALMAPLADAEMTPARHAAMAGLEAAGAGALAPLTAALVAQSATLRTNAAAMLGYLPAASSTDALVRALGDAEPAVRAEAAWALGEIGAAEARTALAAAAQAEGDAAARSAATSALARIDAEVSAQATSFGSALMARASQISASRWTFMALLLMLAAALLLLGPRPPALRTR